MPYIVTTCHYSNPPMPGPRSRRAVATLEEAQLVVLDVLDPHDPHTAQPAVAIPESGGTIGPLPDGTVIEVEQATWRDVALDACGLTYADASVLAVHGERGDIEARQAIFDAYNAKVAA